MLSVHPTPPRLSTGGPALPTSVPARYHEPHPRGHAAATVSTERVFCWWDYLCFGLLTVVTWAALAWVLPPWVRHADWHHQPVLLGLLSALLGYHLACQQFRWFLLPLMRRPTPRPPRTGWSVAVATTFVPGAEPLEMLEDTVQALVAMAYPHDTWVLDEGDDAHVKALCTRLGARHFSRKPFAYYQTREGPFQARSKHGNYNAWLNAHGLADYDILVNFDPDHVPEPTFLDEVLGYFDDPRVGYVQAAQAYYNERASFIARGAAEETYAYYSSTQMASYALGLPIVTGCHTAHRVAALNEVGGFAAHDADDLLVTYHYRAAGWQGVYVPKVLARGLTPVDWAGYLAQQRRWARSVLDIKFKRYPRLAGRLSPAACLLGGLHGLYYLQGLTAGVGVGLLAYLLASGQAPQLFTDGTLWRWLGLYAVLQAVDGYRQRFFLDRRREWGFHWRASLLQWVKWPYVGLALLEVLLGRRHGYAITPKVRTARTSHPVARAHLPVVGLLGLAWLTGVGGGDTIPAALHLWTAAIVAGTLALVWTERWAFPAPYDPMLRACGPATGGMNRPMDSGARLAAQARTIALARQFPALRTAPGGSPWDPEALDASAASGMPGSGARWAAVFILTPWNPAEAWRAGRFDAFEAVAAWDRDHCQVFLTWAHDPWWP
jgi:cellulose synthase (UDP-forming)